MRTASLREIKSRFSHYLKKAEREDIVVTTNGKPCDVPRGLSGEELEDYIISNSPSIRKKVEEAATTLKKGASLWMPL